VTFQDWATFILIFVCGCFGLEAIRRPSQGRLFWACAIVCLLCLAFVLVLEAAHPAGM
jgi:hypothetical protein